ncbi:MAG: SPOR domain-containing protein [Gammaproteobacteria bacterium]|jgi:hypothetical protein
MSTEKVTREAIRAFEEKMRTEGADGFAAGPHPWESWDVSGNPQDNDQIWDNSALHEGNRKPVRSGPGERLLNGLAMLALLALLTGIAGVYFSDGTEQDIVQKGVQPLPIIRNTAPAHRPVPAAAQAHRPLPPDAETAAVAVPGTGGAADPAGSPPETPVPETKAPAVVAMDAPPADPVATAAIPAPAGPGAAAAEARTAVVPASTPLETGIEAPPAGTAAGIVPPAPTANEIRESEAPAAGHRAAVPADEEDPGDIPAPSADNNKPEAAAAPLGEKVAASEPAAPAPEATGGTALPAADQATVAGAASIARQPPGDAAPESVPQAPAVIPPPPPAATAEPSLPAVDAPLPGAPAAGDAVAAAPVMPAVQPAEPTGAAGNDRRPAATAETAEASPPAAPEPAVAQPPKAAAFMPPDTSGNWAVNLVSYTHETAARRTLKEYRQQGVDAEIQTVTINDRPMYRVRVVGYESLPAAQAQIAPLQKLLGLDSVWVSRK